MVVGLSVLTLELATLAEELCAAVSQGLHPGCMASPSQHLYKDSVSIISHRTKTSNCVKPCAEP